MATNTASGRFQRRSQRLQRAGGGAPPLRLDAGPAGESLPGLRPLPPAPLVRRQQPGLERRSIASLLRSVVLAVNARGLCAAHAARVAELPADEVQGIQQLCRCADCLRQSAH